MKEFIKPWRECPRCRHCYQNELRIDIATEFVSFIRGKYSDDIELKLRALWGKLCALMAMYDRLQPVQRSDAVDAANGILSLIDQMKVNSSPLSRNYFQLEANAYNTLGRIALNEGTEDSARRAVVHFETQLKLNNAIGFSRGIAAAKCNMQNQYMKVAIVRRY